MAAECKRVDDSRCGGKGRLPRGYISSRSTFGTCTIVKHCKSIIIKVAEQIASNSRKGCIIALRRGDFEAIHVMQTYR